MIVHIQTSEFLFQHVNQKRIHLLKEWKAEGPAILLMSFTLLHSSLIRRQHLETLGNAVVVLGRGGQRALTWEVRISWKQYWLFSHANCM
jgi:hypothetical protein